MPVQAAYYKPRPAVPKSTVAAAALAAAQWTNSGMAPVPPADEVCRDVKIRPELVEHMTFQLTFC